jgi:hypothetical protein
MPSIFQARLAANPMELPQMLLKMVLSDKSILALIFGAMWARIAPFAARV